MEMLEELQNEITFLKITHHHFTVNHTVKLILMQ